MIIDQIYSKARVEKTVDGKDERQIRSVLKALSWRAFGTLDTILISWLILGDLSIALSIGSVELITKTVLYYFHERLWNVIKWGKQ